MAIVIDNIIKKDLKDILKTSKIADNLSNEMIDALINQTEKKLMENNRNFSSIQSRLTEMLPTAKGNSALEKLTSVLCDRNNFESLPQEAVNSLQLVVDAAKAEVKKGKSARKPNISAVKYASDKQFEDSSVQNCFKKALQNSRLGKSNNGAWKQNNDSNIALVVTSEMVALAAATWATVWYIAQNDIK